MTYTFNNLKQLPDKTGIYCIRNTINGHIYIGQSYNIRRRFTNYHKTEYLNKNSSCYDAKLYTAFRKYGLDVFEILVLEFCDRNELNEREMHYINLYNSFRNGYNSTSGGDSMSEKMHSNEIERKREITRERNGSLKGDKHPRAKLSNEEVVKIRQRYIDGESCEQIHKDYEKIYPNIGTLKRVIFGATYKSVGNIPQKSQIRYTNKNRIIGKVSKEIVIKIKEEYNPKINSYSELAQKYNLSISVVHQIVKRKIYYNI